jgi:hypothetical protein
VQLLAHACDECIWERRVREIRTPGVTREERVAGHGMRLMRHVRGNPEPEYAEA